MKNIFLIVVFGLFVNRLCAQIPAASYNEYRLYEQLAAEKRLAFVPNPNTYNYDVTYQKLEIQIDPSQYYINGAVTTQFVAQEDMQTIVFDLSHQLQVTAVWQENQLLSYTQGNNELRIDLNEVVLTGAMGEVKVDYEGVPPTENEAFVQSYHNNSPIVWTLSEPFGAKDWWPCKQSLNDKVDSIDIYLKTPQAMVAVANGMEQSQTADGNGWKTTHFKHQYPIPAYLVAIAVTNYEVFEQTAGTSPYTFPIINYLYPENYQSAVNQLAVTLPIMNLFENLFGTYPFHQEKYGHAQFGWGGGMEHTTVSFMGSFSRGLIAHELAHHWFGNKVTCGTWQDIWINEGFAEYMAGLVVAHLDGDEAFVNWKKQKNNSITSATWGNLYLTEEQALDSNRIFNGRLTYNKGSMVVHMLRYVLGDEDFYQGMKQFLNDPELAYGYAVTEQVKNHLEAASGKDLASFFNQWIYSEGYPSYQVAAEIISPSQIKIVLSQTTSHPSVSFFQMPVTLQLKRSNGETELIVLEHTENDQEFMVGVSLLDLQSIEVDPFADIITKDNKVSIQEGVALQSGEIVVFPNPTADTFQVVFPKDMEVLSMDLYDTKGKLIRKNINNPYHSSELSSGVYVLRIETEEQIYHKKVVKN